MKKLLALLGCCILLTTLNARNGDKIVISNWNGYMDNTNGCILNTNIEIIISFKFKNSEPIPPSWTFEYSVGNKNGTIDLDEFIPNNLSGINGYRAHSIPLVIEQEYLTNALHFHFEIKRTSNSTYPHGNLYYFDGNFLVHEGSKPVCGLPTEWRIDPNEITIKTKTPNDQLDQSILLEEVESEERSITSSFEKSNPLTIFPNPFTDQLNINGQVEDNDVMEINLLDLNGQLIYARRKEELFEGDYQYQIDGTNIPPGIYFCHIRTKNDATIQRLIKR